MSFEHFDTISIINKSAHCGKLLLICLLTLQLLNHIMVIICHPNKLYKILSSCHSKETSQKILFISRGRWIQLHVNLFTPRPSQSEIICQSNFYICGQNPTVSPFKWIASAKTFAKHYFKYLHDFFSQFYKKEIWIYNIFWPHDKQKGLMSGQLLPHIM